MNQDYTDIVGNAEMEEGNQRKQQKCFGRVDQKYQSYAMHACNSKFDSKTSFGAQGKSERALRRCVVLLGQCAKRISSIRFGALIIRK